MLKNQPHTFHIIFGISPVAQGIEISQIQFILKALSNTRGCQCYFTCHEILSATFAFMVKQDAVHGKHSVAFTIVLCNPKTILFGNSVWRTRIKRSCLFLRHLLHQSEQFGSRSLINLGLFFQPQDTNCFQHTQCAYRISFSSIFGNIKAYFYMALRCQIIYLIRSDSLNDSN